MQEAQITEKAIVRFKQPEDPSVETIWDSLDDADLAWLKAKSWEWPLDYNQGLRIADLFSGCGGMTLGACLGAESLGLRVNPVLAIDQSKAAMAVYAKNFAPMICYTSDITHHFNGDLNAKVTTSEIAIAHAVGDLHCLFAGPPCQGYSNLNNVSRRSDLRNHLYLRAVRAIQVLRPKFFLVENVADAPMGKEGAVRRAISTLACDGYRVSEGVVDLVSLGAPQKRRRHILIGSERSYIPIKALFEAVKLTSTRTVRWAISDLEDGVSDPLHRAPRLSGANRARIGYLMKQGLYDLPNELRPHCHQGVHSYKSMYGRLRYDSPAQTITSGFRSPGQGRFIHPSWPRTLTIREAARLQFIPDFFDLSPAESIGCLTTMIGNVAPPVLARAFMLACEKAHG